MTANDDDLEIRILIEAAMDMPPEQWRAYLEEHASAPAIAQAVEEMLRVEGELGGFLEKPLVPSPIDALDTTEDSPRWHQAAMRATGDSGHDGNSGSNARPAVREPTTKPHGPARLDAGTVLADRYQVVKWLGGGGGGDVYRVQDQTLDQEVALKVLPATKTNEVRLRYLRAEVRIARQVAHPNVCRVFDVGESDGLHFLTMELIEGEDLAARLKQEGALPPGRAAEVGAQICDGLAAVHAKGILHRDLKPANVLLDKNGNAQLVDFGVAGLKGEKVVGGTPNYMAPELFEGQAPTVQSELYALGLILYQLFTGRRPFSAPIKGGGSRDQSPRPPSELCHGLTTTIEQTILCCLSRQVAARPGSAVAVAVALRGGDVPREATAVISLRSWSAPSLPSEPFPLLLPYRHPELLAGRDEELDQLLRWLELPRPIIGLSAVSGTGKSSLLAGGLYPSLRAQGRPAVLERHPAEPGLAGRLLDGLVDVPGGLAIADSDFAGFAKRLEEVEDLADGAPPVLIIDQLEDLFRRSDGRRSRAILGMLLAATCGRRPGREAPPCRWVLAYREEYFGELRAWLRNVLADAETLGLAVDSPEWRLLPSDLSDLDRFQACPLTPLATPSGASDDPKGEAVAMFRRALETPLQLCDEDGRRRYPWRFADGGVDRLARALAEARLAQPKAPLAPELQVVLAHLQSTAQPTPDGRVIHVPEDVDSLMDRALEAHLRRCLEQIFPTARGAAQRRARALLALRELAGTAGTQEAALSESALVKAIGAEGRQILELLSGPAARLVIADSGPDGRRWQLSHDRLAEAVTRLADEEGRSGGLVIDSELLALRRRIALQSALFAAGETTSIELAGKEFRRIANHADALLWDPARRAWWQACRQKRRASLVRRITMATAALIMLTLAGLTIRAEIEKRTERATVLRQISEGDPEGAVAALAAVLAAAQEVPEHTFTQEELLAALGLRATPFDIFEHGLGGLTEPRRAEQVLILGELVLPMVEEVPADEEEEGRYERRLASLLWALHYSPMRDPGSFERARALRNRALAPLWAAHPPPTPDRAAEGWVFIPGHEIAAPLVDSASDRMSITSFEMLAHEVTNAEYRRLVPDHQGDDEKPAGLMTWYEAVIYAAWLGGPDSITRLPTDAEWFFAARAGCEHNWCTRDGKAAEISDIAWWAGSFSLEDTKAKKLNLSPVGLLAPNQNGLYDMYGNVWEWTASWVGPGSKPMKVDPVGPSAGRPPLKIFRGGSASSALQWVHPTERGTIPPARKRLEVGLRPIRIPTEKPAPASTTARP